MTATFAVLTLLDQQQAALEWRRKAHAVRIYNPQLARHWMAIAVANLHMVRVILTEASP